MDAGLEVILELGLNQVRVRDIAERAKLGIGTFYFHFTDLAEFQSEVIRAYLAKRGQTERSIAKSSIATQRLTVKQGISP
jgi:AcrR family transcriptional regulator